MSLKRDQTVNVVSVRDRPFRDNKAIGPAGRPGKDCRNRALAVARNARHGERQASAEDRLFKGIGRADDTQISDAVDAGPDLAALRKLLVAASLRVGVIID